MTLAALYQYQAKDANQTGLYRPSRNRLVC